MDNQRNFLLAALLSLLVVFAWQFFIIQPRIEQERLLAEQKAAEAGQTLPGQSQSGQPQAGSGGEGSAVPRPSAQDAGASAVPGGAGAGQAASGNGAETRIALKTPKLEGSINLRGARIDDLRLLDYHETVDPTSPTIRLLKPGSNQNAYFAEFGFSPSEGLGDLPGPSTIWTQTGSGELTPTNPITLTYDNGQGITFERTIAVDETYMFTVSDSVRNATGGAVVLTPYGRVARFGDPDTEGVFVLHEGMIGAVGDQGLDEIDYDEIKEDTLVKKEPANQGWLGITDKYWATALIPGGRFTAAYRYITAARPFFQTEFINEGVTINNGATASIEHRLFAGAKNVNEIDAYQENLDIPLFDKIIDWGWFYWITKPLFLMLDYFYDLIGNFGVAILIVTVIIKIIFFPLANKSYASMAKMKTFQPQMKEIQERYKDDRQAQQKAMMDLYKKEKINPAAGCWPMLVQIPVFFALYKVLYVTIEMRHAPFFGWIEDLSAPDPTSIFNLFGLLPYDVPGILLIGVWPLLMGITMFIQMQMNPAPPDPTQQMIFRWMPVVFTFMLATFPAGLVIYWAWNNFLSIIQQGTIMRRHGAKIELWDNVKGLVGKNKGSG